MLVLSRKYEESVIIGRTADGGPMLRLVVLAITGGRVKLGFEAAHDVPVFREEVWAQLQIEKHDGAAPGVAARDRAEQASNGPQALRSHGRNRP